MTRLPDEATIIRCRHLLETVALLLAETALVHTVVSTAANVDDIYAAQTLLHG
ncbi:hypothetical protein AWB77_03875 [Caballeronia fortuita]|uniref:Uncharacterized protein n=1 Tax=Caballeronia fortuita TaxID=1777138 RepID=A0A158CCZ8_9BURK|nr:hypothetical protein AWB77_03875 [Caballeronia fortuita]